MKTYDPVSGIVLKYKTDKVAEVGRLIAGLRKCGRVMAAMSPSDDEGDGDKKNQSEQINNKGGVHMATAKEDKTVPTKTGGSSAGKKKRIKR